MKQMATKRSTSDHSVWNRFGHAGVLRQWADEIKTALVQKATVDRWSLVGHAVFIEHADIEESLILASQIASHAGIFVTKTNYTRNAANTATVTNVITITGGLITGWTP